MSLSVRTEFRSWRRAQPLLGTFVEVTLEGPEDVYPAQTFDAVFAEVARVHRLMSWYETESDVSRINRMPAGRWARIDPRTVCVLHAASRMYERSGGLFDVTCERHLRRAGVLPEGPIEGGAQRQGTMSDLLLDEEGGVFLKQPLTINLDGIAKGYAVDQAIALLNIHGVRSGCVNAGGDLRLFGPVAQEIGLRNPRRPTEIWQLGRYRACAVATTGGYFLNTQADVPSAVVDPVTGQPVAVSGSVTVTASLCMHADALTKIATLMRPDDAVVAQLFKELDAHVYHFPRCA
ncbi:FAD:protein FMN transferase [Candidatus Macondimonas diazotrophica]|nr:FAD:protein FMN transferase [Candidatus Macondimonas diazotrophica]